MTEDPLKLVRNQVRRLTEERDLLLSAIAPADYDRIKDQLVAVSESLDE